MERAFIIQRNDRAQYMVDFTTNIQRQCISTDKDATDAYFAQFSTVSHNAEDTPQPIPDLNGELETTPGSESSLQASLQQQIPVKVRWYL